MHRMTLREQQKGIVTPTAFSETRELVQAAAVGDEDALQEIHTGLAVLKALRRIRNDCNPRNALLLIGKYYFDMTLEELGKLFHVDKSTVSKALKVSGAQ
jgi:DNA-directed RNA polymerase specialized sigma24 family protein